MDIDIGRRQYVTPALGHQRPMRPHLVVAMPKDVQRFPCLGWALIRLPIHLFVLEGLVKAFQEPELGGRTILNTHMGEFPLDMSLEAAGDKAWPIIRDQKRRLKKRPVPALGLGSGTIERRGHILVGPLDEAALVYPWLNPDPEVDALHTQIRALVQQGATKPNDEIFGEIWKLAHERAGRPTPSCLQWVLDSLRLS